MKACVIQPPYSTEYGKSDYCFDVIISLMDKCDSSMDIIVLPECCDIPALANTLEEREKSIEKYNKIILAKAKETAERCKANVFINARSFSEKGLINTTYAFKSNGEIAGMYFKEHPTPGEMADPERDNDYVYKRTEPTIIEIDGIRYGFLTCYDFYFYESFGNIARYKPDIIIGCSHQRTDSHNIIEATCKFLAYNTNTYVVRSSVSMDETAEIGGGSMIVTPKGEVLINMESRVGFETAEFDPKEKLSKPAGFGNPSMPHYEYIEQGRNPWKYRPAGSAITLPDKYMSYPRTCAHRGFSTVAPENSMAAYGAAIGMGADEIEFDLRCTKDGEIVILHDESLDRVTDGTGNVKDYTYEELSNLDFGIKHDEKFKGLKVVKFEDVLKKFACHTIMNIHIYQYSREILKRIVSLIDKYDCRQYVYFMNGFEDFLEMAIDVAPDITRCCGGCGTPEKSWSIVDRAIKYGCKKVQLVKGYFNQEMIDKAHAHGIICNVFWADDEDEALKFLEMGADTILTNEFNLIYRVVEKYKNR